MNELPAVHYIRSADTAASVLNPLRTAILNALNEPDSASGLARRLDMPRQKVNYHVRLLQDEGLIRQVGERQARGFTEVVMQTVARSYLISPAALAEIGADPKTIADQASSDYLAASAAEVIRDISELRESADRQEKRLATLTMRTSIRFENPDAQRRFADELTRLTASLVERYHRPEASAGRSFKLMTGLYQQPEQSTHE